MCAGLAPRSSCLPVTDPRCNLVRGVRSVLSHITTGTAKFDADQRNRTIYALLTGRARSCINPDEERAGSVDRLGLDGVHLDGRYE